VPYHASSFFSRDQELRTANVPDILISTLLISIFSWIDRKPTVSTARTDSTQLSFPANPGCEEAAQLRSCPAASSCRVPRAPRTAVGRVSSCCPLRSLAPLSFFWGDLVNYLYAECAAESLFPLSAGRCISSERAAVYSDNRLYGCPRVEAEMKLFSCVFFQLFKKREVEKLLRKSCPILTGGNSMHWLCERSH
jgi:hypothetical protein